MTVQNIKNMKINLMRYSLTLAANG